MGLGNTLRLPEFQNDPMMASGVVEVLEQRVSNLLDHVEVDDKVRYYIGEDHLLPEIQSCSLIIKGYQIRDQKGVIGVIGPMRMDYAYNTVALDLVSDLLRTSL